MVKCQKVFAVDCQNLLSLSSCWKTSGVLCPLLATHPLNCIYTQLMQILRMLLNRLLKKSATRRVMTLKRSFFLWLQHASSSFAIYKQNRPEQG